MMIKIIFYVHPIVKNNKTKVCKIAKEKYILKKFSFDNLEKRRKTLQVPFLGR